MKKKVDLDKLIPFMEDQAINNKNVPGLVACGILSLIQYIRENAPCNEK